MNRSNLASGAVINVRHITIYIQNWRCIVTVPEIFKRIWLISTIAPSWVEVMQKWYCTTFFGCFMYALLCLGVLMNSNKSTNFRSLHSSYGPSWGRHWEKIEFTVCEQIQSDQILFLLIHFSPIAITDWLGNEKMKICRHIAFSAFSSHCNYNSLSINISLNTKIASNMFFLKLEKKSQSNRNHHLDIFSSFVN